MSAVQDRARELELELLRVRREAEAARLDARAAELELLLRRLLREDASVDAPVNAPIPASGAIVEAAAAARPTVDPWSDRIQRLRLRDAIAPVMPTRDASRDASPGASSGSRVGSGPHVASHDDWAPGKPPRRSEPCAALQPSVDPPAVEAPTTSISAPGERVEQDLGDPATTSAEVDSLAAESRKQRVPTTAPIAASDLTKSNAAPPALALTTAAGADDDVSKARTKRVRPASWLVSMLAHLVILLVLGFMTLANTMPKDQVALVASASELSEESIETFAIESAQPAETAPTMAEPIYEVSAIGTMAINDVPLDISAATSVMTSSELLQGSLSSSDRQMLESISKDSASKMQFCGVDGGGNHFVYLVDSSGSMRDGFYSARTELLASIDQLQPHQRFYVVFFDEEPEYMRIHDPNVDEPASVMATPENKQRLRKWAMKVQMNPGKAPYEVLPFALRLRPDVIFLLSDGEFPSRIEDILNAQNRQDNLFGEDRPICIVHTIRYHGVEGETGRKAEATMVKIAKENGGQYRHVPRPK